MEHHSYALVRLDSFITLDSESAKNVTFHPDIKMKSITFDGDVYDPNGSLSGGSRALGGGVLLKMRERKLLRSKLSDAANILRNIMERLNKCNAEDERYSKTKQELDLKTHQVKLLKEQSESNSSSKILARVESLQSELQDLKSLIETNTARVAAALQRQKELEIEIDQLTNNRDQKLISLQV